MFWRSSRAFPSSLTSVIEEIEGPPLVILLEAAEALAGAVGGLLVAERLCLDAGGALFTPSETEARGRAADEDLTEAADPVGDTTVGRVAVNLTVVDKGGADGLAGARDALRVGGTADTDIDAPVEDGGGFEDAISGLGGGAEVDFLRGGAEVVGLLVTSDWAGPLGTVVFTVPAPNVPELIIYQSVKICRVLLSGRTNLFYQR